MASNEGGVSSQGLPPAGGAAAGLSGAVGTERERCSYGAGVEAPREAPQVLGGHGGNAAA